MNKLAMALVIVMLAAGSAGAGEGDKTQEEICANVATYAETLMDARHKGVPMQKLIEIAAENVAGAKISRTMIIDAYESPRFTTPEIVRQSVEDFRDRWYLRCIKAR